MNIQNKNPVIYSKIKNINSSKNKSIYTEDPISVDEIFSFHYLIKLDIIRNIVDPEHPISLEELGVVSPNLISIDYNRKIIDVLFTPTIPHCSLSTVIGLCIITKLHRSLSINYKINVKISPGTHNQEDQINKQLNDKERVSAALENVNLMNQVSKCLKATEVKTEEIQDFISQINF